MTQQEAAALVAVLKAAYPRQPIELETVRVYGQMLADLEYEDVERAAREHMAASPYFPAISELRERATRPAGLLDADQAWAEVRTAVGRWGRDREPQWPTPQVAVAVTAIGWQHICNTPEDQLGTLRAQFRDAYKAAAGRAVREANVGRLEAHRAELALAAGDVVKQLSERNERTGGRP